MPSATNSAAIVEENDECSICLEKMKEKGEIDSCKHKFCVKCIVKWSKVTNLCPICKKKFNSVTTIPVPKATGTSAPKRGTKRKQSSQSEPKAKIVKVKDRSQSVAYEDTGIFGGRRPANIQLPPFIFNEDEDDEDDEDYEPGMNMNDDDEWYDAGGILYGGEANYRRESLTARLLNAVYGAMNNVVNAQLSVVGPTGPTRHRARLRSTPLTMPPVEAALPVTTQRPIENEVIDLTSDHEDNLDSLNATTGTRRRRGMSLFRPHHPASPGQTGVRSQTAVSSTDVVSNSYVPRSRNASHVHRSMQEQNRSAAPSASRRGILNSTSVPTSTSSTTSTSLSNLFSGTRRSPLHSQIPTSSSASSSSVPVSSTLTSSSARPVSVWMSPDVIELSDESESDRSLAPTNSRAVSSASVSHPARRQSAETVERRELNHRNRRLRRGGVMVTELQRQQVSSHMSNMS
mmetsp:Transcript_6720/g.6942  ORF Transcript_6720/g.6942 Transcript_6720/m.6942 type:complete len:460 (+) Transcript_6720:89-1468(+)